MNEYCRTQCVKYEFPLVSHKMHGFRKLAKLYYLFISFKN